MSGTNLMAARLLGLRPRTAPTAPDPAPCPEADAQLPIDVLVRRIRGRRASRAALPVGSPAWEDVAAEEEQLLGALRRLVGAANITAEGLDWLIGRDDRGGGWTMVPGTPAGPTEEPAAPQVPGHATAPPTAARAAPRRARRLATHGS